MKKPTFVLLRDIPHSTIWYLFVVCMLFLLVINCEKAPETGWTTYRHDIARSGVTDERLSPPLSLQWVFKPNHAPKPAWYKPSEELPRTNFDNAHYVTVAGGVVYFGSTVDHKVYAVNARTGEIKWTFFTEGPIRFAPTIRKNRVYVGSDDGYMYCLKASNGKLVWKYRAGPRNEKVLGNENMISLWPVRTSVLVDDGIAYFGAGVFPYEGIFICALNADNGSLIWKNDTIGDHAHDLIFGGMSPQGYLIASENILYVPSGRALPAAFDRKTGEFLYYTKPVGSYPNDHYGGTWALLDKNELIVGVERMGVPAKVAHNSKTGEQKGDAYAWFPGIDMVVTPKAAYVVTVDGLFALDRVEHTNVEKKVEEGNIEKKKLKSTISDLTKKLAESDSETRMEINYKINNIRDNIYRLTEEENKLKSSRFIWKYPRKNINSTILAGSVVFAGGESFVAGIDRETGQELWSEKINGRAYGLAASNGCLFVSTDKGSIYCYKEGITSRSKEIRTPINPSPYPEDKLTGVFESVADRIIRETGITKGYCLVLGCGDGRLAFELAGRSELKIVGIEKDRKKARKARERLDEAGILGSRVIVEEWALSTLPDYFANLIVYNNIPAAGKIEYSPEEMYRVLRPCGGAAYFGQHMASPKTSNTFNLKKVQEWLKRSGITESDTVRENPGFIMLTRGKLEGAGSWTHLYGNPQNTACSDDLLVKGPLGVLWFGEPGPERLVERHARSVAPVSINGYLFQQGENVIKAYDAYNGTFLWKREIPGAVRVRVDVDGQNIALTGNGLYVAAYDKCYRLALATGEIVSTYEMPASPDGGPRRWGYVSCTGNILYGSTAMPLKERYAQVWETYVEDGKWKNIEDIPPQYDYQTSSHSYYRRFGSFSSKPDSSAWMDFHRTGSLWKGMADFPSWGSQRSPKGVLTDKMLSGDSIFAVDTETGNLLWVHKGKKISNITTTIGDGTLFFTESTVTPLQKKQALTEKRKLVKKGAYEVGDEDRLSVDDTDIRLVVALDAATGGKRWQKPLDVTGCGGDKMGIAYSNGVLVFFGHFSNHDSGLFINGLLKYRRITALSANTGGVLWSRPLNYLRRPVIVGDKIYVEPRACDLFTGKIKMRAHPITGKQVQWEFLRPGHCCSITSASPSMLLYRSYSTAFYDLAEDRGITIFGGIRPGCWINMIPANGLLLMPEASSGCTCSFPIKCSVAFKPRHKKSEEWSVFITHGAMTPVKHFSINLGAPADMKDDSGTVWFGYPNPKTDQNTRHQIRFPNYGVKFDLKENILENMGYFASDFRDKKFQGTDKPWLFTSGCVGLTQCEIPLLDDTGDSMMNYTVYLGFMSMPDDRSGQRIFDIKIQGVPVLENFDIVKSAGGTEKPIIKKFTNIPVRDVLTIELLPEKEAPENHESTLINFIEVVREGETI